jgi:hypothetical protein
MTSIKTKESQDLSKKREASMNSKVRLRDRLFCSVKLCSLICTIVLAAAVGIGCTSASDEARQGPEQSAPAASQTETEAQPGVLEVSDELQITPQVASCSSQHGICINRSVCLSEGGVLLSSSGCASGTPCCRINACLNAGDFCTTLTECRNEGNTTGLSGCSTGQVCCQGI